MTPKFRAWIYDYQMIQVEQLQLTPKLTIRGIERLERLGGVPMIEQQRWFYEFEFILMQSTGPFIPYHSTRQIELFVDDICKFTRTDRNKSLVDKVIYSHGMFHFSNWSVSLRDEIFSDIEIIGNIHQNPELLKSTS